MSLNKKTISDGQAALDALRRIVRALRNNSKFTEKTVGLSAAQIFVLQKLSSSKKPLSINELADATLTHQSSVSMVVSKLVERKLVERSVSANDSRAAELNINKEGSYLLSKCPPSFQEQLMNGFEQMTRKEQTNLAQGLQMLIEKAGMEHEEATMLLEDGLHSGNSKK